MYRIALTILIAFLAMSTDVSAQSREAEIAEANIVRAFSARRYERALQQIDTYLARWPESPNMIYNQACAYALMGNREASSQSLLRAVERGFREFGQMKLDPDLASMRDHPTFQAIIEAENRVDRNSSIQQVERWKKRWGEYGYTFDSDPERNLHFITSVDATSHRQMKDMLQKQADQMSDSLFTTSPDYWCLIAVPTAKDAKKIFESETTAGVYVHNDRQLISRDIGASMRHEFAHLMHYGDMERRNQRHAMWVQEGIASLYEDYEISSDGSITFAPNLRHNIARNQINRNLAVDLQDLFDMTPRRFMKGNARYYPQVRSLFEFLADLKLLEEWYEMYTETWDRSPEGTLAWEKIFGVPLEDVERRWKKWVVGRGEIDVRIDYGDASIGVAGEDAGDGIKITSVQSRNARRAGLRQGDVIVAVDTTPVRARGELVQAIAKKRVGERVRLRIRRNGDYRNVVVILAPLGAESR